MLPWGVLTDEATPDCFLEKYFAIRQSGLKSKQWCRVHSNFCDMTTEDIDIEIGGFPCQPSSRLGYGLKEQDPRFVCLITWSFDLKRRDVLTALLENTHETLHFRWAILSLALYFCFF